METTKVCTKCDQELPISDFYGAKTGRDLLRGECRFCKVRTKNSYRSKNLARFQDIDWLCTKKQCNKCKKIKSHYQFPRDAGMKDGCLKKCLECYRQKGERRHYEPHKVCNFATLRSGAMSKGKAFALTREQYVALIACNACHYCGGELPKRGGGLDRIDNSRGYEPGNVVPCCTACNRIRGDNLTYEEMLELAPAIKRIFARRVVGQAA